MLSEDLIYYIKTLSKRDKKNLSQKTLKAMEELGELSKKILPYENAFATNHRIFKKSEVLEEVADTILCLLSIAYDLDATDEEIEDIIIRKSALWAEKQDAEMDLKNKIPYEIHVSVQINSLQIEDFKDTCKLLNVKPIVIDLQNDSGAFVMRDVMTSSKHFGNNTSVMSEVECISKYLKADGFNVVREKVESIPWHPAAPRRKNKSHEMPKGCYFESHFAVLLGNEYNGDTLNYIASKNDLHRSNNIFKTYTNGNRILMFTLRSYTGTYEDFLEKVEIVKNDFKEYDFDLEKVEVEFAIYDSKEYHDNIWIRNEL